MKQKRKELTYDLIKHKKKKRFKREKANRLQKLIILKYKYISVLIRSLIERIKKTFYFNCKIIQNIHTCVHMHSSNKNE